MESENSERLLGTSRSVSAEGLVTPTRARLIGPMHESRVMNRLAKLCRESGKLMEFSADRLTSVGSLRGHWQGLPKALDFFRKGHGLTIFGLWVCLDQMKSIDHLLESHRVVRGEI